MKGLLAALLGLIAAVAGVLAIISLLPPGIEWVVTTADAIGTAISAGISGMYHTMKTAREEDPVAFGIVSLTISLGAALACRFFMSDWREIRLPSWGSWRPRRPRTKGEKGFVMGDRS